MAPYFLRAAVERALPDFEKHLADNTYSQEIDRIDYSVRKELTWGARGLAEAAASPVASAEGRLPVYFVKQIKSVRDHVLEDSTPSVQDTLLGTGAISSKEYWGKRRN